jgi:hypothetical protein
MMMAVSPFWLVILLLAGIGTWTNRFRGSFLSIAGAQSYNPSHPLTDELTRELRKCESDVIYCEQSSGDIIKLAAKLANEYSALLLHDEAQRFFEEAFYYVSPRSTVGMRLNHIMAVLAFSQGDMAGAEKHWSWMGGTDLVSQRSHAAQVLMGGVEGHGIDIMSNYSRSMGQRFQNVLTRTGITSIDLNTTFWVDYRRYMVANKMSATEGVEETLLSLLLGEAQGGIRLHPKLSDVLLALTTIRALDAKQRFRLGVGLAKLGLFDLSLRHVSLSATPWEAPLHRLRAKLVFAPVHSSVRSLAEAVDAFERQGESILLHAAPKSPLMIPICNSLNEAALALQALPLLHLAGFAAPREHFLLGHSPIALPILLSEVFVSMCPPRPPTPELYAHASDVASLGQQEILVIGVVAGSLDATPGRIILGKNIASKYEI